MLPYSVSFVRCGRLGDYHSRSEAEVGTHLVYLRDRFSTPVHPNLSREIHFIYSSASSYLSRQDRCGEKAAQTPALIRLDTPSCIASSSTFVSALLESYGSLCSREDHARHDRRRYLCNSEVHNLRCNDGLASLCSIRRRRGSTARTGLTRRAVYNPSCFLTFLPPMT